MHRPGIEPGPPAWQARIVPLNHRCLANFNPLLNYILKSVWVIVIVSWDMGVACAIISVISELQIVILLPLQSV